MMVQTEFQNVFKENSGQWTQPKIIDMFAEIHLHLHTALQMDYFDRDLQPLFCMNFLFSIEHGTSVLCLI